jgi:hypothetical protein
MFHRFLPWTVVAGPLALTVTLSCGGNSPFGATSSALVGLHEGRDLGRNDDQRAESGGPR